jgi:hypothetical protein
LILVAIGSVRIAATYKVFSFTIDEPGHFASGLEYLSKHSRDPDRTLALMRLGILPFFWLACAVVYLWSRRHFPAAVAMLAVALFTQLPPVLAFAGLACTDMALAACLGAAFLALILWAESPASSRWKRAAVLGAATALAALSKFTALLYLPAAAAIALLFYLAAERAQSRMLGQVAAVALLLWIAISGAICHPDHLSYFNEFAEREPARILVDSNLDWGQDAVRRLYGLPRVRPVDVSSPGEQGWRAVAV